MRWHQNKKINGGRGSEQEYGKAISFDTPPNLYFLFWQCFSLLVSHIIRYLPKQNHFVSTVLPHVFTALYRQQFLLPYKMKHHGKHNVSFCKFLLENSKERHCGMQRVIDTPCPLCLCLPVYTTSIAWNNKALTRRVERSTGAAQQREQRQTQKDQL